MTGNLETYREYEKKEHARVRDLMNEVMLAWLKLQWKRDRECHVESMYQLEVNGDSTHMPASVQHWEDDLPAYEGCPTCGYGGEEHIIIHFTTTAGNKAVMKHQIDNFGEFISDLCYVRED